MADTQGAVNRSLLWMLSASICGTILLVGIAAALMSFWFAFGEARDLQDDALREIARLAVANEVRPFNGPATPLAGDEAEMRIWVTHTVNRAARPSGASWPLALPAGLADGFHTLSDHGESWRVYLRSMAGASGVAVAQRTAARDEIARDSALRTLVPLLAVIPMLVMLAGFLIRLLLRKVHALALELDKKDDMDFSPVATNGIPAEIMPFAASTNSLLTRVRDLLAQQRRLVANAAHELRSPVAAMTLQLDNALALEAMPEPVRQRLAPLAASIARMTRLVEQLLLLARLTDASQPVPQMIDVQAIVNQVIGELLPLAEARSIDLGLVDCERLALDGHEADFRAIVRNAIENALKYTPPHGKVDVHYFLREDDAVFEVRDSGPGLAAGELERVFDPFYRLPGSDQPGSGLGLAIARCASERLGGRIMLYQPAPGSTTGLVFAYQQKLGGMGSVGSASR